MKNLRKILTLAIASVWLINGLFCKVLNFAPRHQQIVARILGEDISWLAIKTIGVLEIFMFVWIISKIGSRWCAITQIMIVATMNILEFFLVPDILLFGRINIVVSIIFISAVYINEFLFPDQTVQPQ